MKAKKVLNFFSSCSMNKYYSDTVVRIGKNNLGFSLVELIIVIAIMAILAGIAIPVLGVFIEKAEKNNDQQLISDILRAIEIGNKSGAYVNDDSFKMGDLSYPIGFIILSDTPGLQIITSSTETTVVEGECKFETRTIQYVTSGIQQMTCSKKDDEQVDQTIYTLHTLGEVEYCVTHSQVYQPETNETYTRAYDTATGCTGENEGCDHTAHVFTVSESIVIDTNMWTVAPDKEYHIQTRYKDTGTCEAAHAHHYSTPNVGPADFGDPLFDALYAAFGDDLATLSLTYDEWEFEDGLNYATILNNGEGVLANIEEMVNALLVAKNLEIFGQKVLESYIDNYLSEDYENSDDMLDAYSAHVVKQYPPEENGEENWMAVWIGAKDGGLDYTFGMGDAAGYHHDFVYGSAKAYNMCFSSYCSVKGVPSTFTDVIENFTTPPNEGSLSGLGDLVDIIPRVVNNAAFDGIQFNEEKTLKDKMIAAGANAGFSQAESETWFNKCDTLYQEYIASEAYEENGRTVYNMLTTVDETIDVANSYAEQNGGSIINYYSSYFSEMSALYNAAQTAAGDGIIIIVTVENGVINYQISPAAADPRNR